ncbi:MAG: adenylate/guanylate cyclase domain-containing protein [Chloroflexi bacterium]|nr:adenylate/guanylate cyclase domain-containing protein [Chloroflexota bacterium]
MAKRAVGRPLLRWLPFALVLPALAVVALSWLLAHPQQNLELRAPLEHSTIVSNVSALALAVAVVLARTALQTGQGGMFLLALGFMSMAGLFAVHAIVTPGVLLKDQAEQYGRLTGLSAYLSLFVPALFFSARYARLPAGFAQRLPLHPSTVFVAVAGALLGYAVIGIWMPALLAGLPLSSPPVSYGLAIATVLLLGFATWRQTLASAAARLPTHTALVVAFLLLAGAQAAMTLAPLWTLAWWEYHGLMLAAVVLALGATFVELDRRRGLERFLPATVVERVLSGDPLRLAGERRVVTVLFADLRDMTPLAEMLPAEAVVELLNAYLGALARCVLTHGGMLDKFLGDGLMAVFGVLDDPSDGAVPAARAVLHMRKAMQTLNNERTARAQPPIKFGVGMHTGVVVLGSVGLPERSDYTAIGDVVNTAARLEGVCKRFDVDCVLTGETSARLARTEFALRALGDIRVRGKTASIAAFTLA